MHMCDPQMCPWTKYEKGHWGDFYTSMFVFMKMVCMSDLDKLRVEWNNEVQAYIDHNSSDAGIKSKPSVIDYLPQSTVRRTLNPGELLIFVWQYSTHSYVQEHFETRWLAAARQFCKMHALADSCNKQRLTNCFPTVSERMLDYWRKAGAWEEMIQNVVRYLRLDPAEWRD